MKQLHWLLILFAWASLPGAMGDQCVENPYERSGLAAWEKELIRDCPVSAMGRVIFNTSAASSLAQSHFILGLKALHNFW